VGCGIATDPVSRALSPGRPFFFPIFHLPLAIFNDKSGPGDKMEKRITTGKIPLPPGQVRQ
jgi:hypothetical protein